MTILAILVAFSFLKPWGGFFIWMAPLIGIIQYEAGSLKVVPGGCHRYFFGVKVKTVKLIGRTRFLAARSGLNAQIIQMMAFTQIMAIWTPAITP